MSFRILATSLSALVLSGCLAQSVCVAQPFVQGNITEQLPDGGQRPLGAVIVTVHVERTNQRLDVIKSNSATGFYKLNLGTEVNEPVIVTFTPENAELAVSSDRLLAGNTLQQLSKVLEPGGSLKSYSIPAPSQTPTQKSKPLAETDAILQNSLNKLLDFEAFNYRMQRFSQQDQYDQWTYGQITRYLQGMPSPQKLRSLGGNRVYRQSLYQALVQKYNNVRSLYGMHDRYCAPVKRFRFRRH